jgi:hypothetical protein
MATYPVKAKKRVPQKARKDEVAVEPVRTSFFNFRYSSTEVSLIDGKTRIKSRQTRFEDGKLTSEGWKVSCIAARSTKRFARLSGSSGNLSRYSCRSAIERLLL